MQQVVMTDRDVEQVPRRDARGIMVVVLGSWCRYFNETGSELRCQTRGRPDTARGCWGAIAGKPGLYLLVSAKRIAENVLQQDSWLPVECRGLRAIVVRV